MKITKKWLDEKGACVLDEEKLRAETEFDGDILKIVKHLMSKNRFQDANWLITHCNTEFQNVQYAIFAAEQVLYIFEDRFPEDNRPRLAITAAKEYLENQSEETYAADTAYTAAYAAANTAACAADTAAKKELQEKIIENGLKNIKNDIAKGVIN